MPVPSKHSYTAIPSEPNSEKEFQTTRRNAVSFFLHGCLPFLFVVIFILLYRSYVVSLAWLYSLSWEPLLCQHWLVFQSIKRVSGLGYHIIDVAMMLT